MKEQINQISAEIETSKKNHNHMRKAIKQQARARKSTLELTKLFKDYRKVTVEESKRNCP